MKGIITGREEFLYPDTELGELKQEYIFSTTANGKKGIQILLEASGGEIELEWNLPELSVELYQMRAIPVEYNTGDGVAQGGSMVVERWEDSMGEYVTRKAPFFVYDCLIPLQNQKIPVTEGRAAVYLCFDQKNIFGLKKGSLIIKNGNEEMKIHLSIKAYDVKIPEGTFSVSNWFSLAAIERMHEGTEFTEILRKYVRAMKRTHQTTFFLELDQKCVKDFEKKEFDFEYLTPMIQIFKEEQISTLEIGPILSRGYKKDGRPDMYTAEFRCGMFPEILFSSKEGAEITEKYIHSLAVYLEKYGWNEEVLIHIHDEPDVHYENETALEKRRQQYHLVREMIKQYMPKARIIEAVGTAKFKDEIDVLVPVTSCYEQHREEFEQCVGKEVWNYVCCGPEGKWLNRFLDFALIKGRILFWGFAKYKISGFLHWGFNQFPEQMDPFKGTSCYNPTGIGSNFPCGDAFIVYPGKDEPWLSMRLEAQRQGAEDAMLLQMLAERKPEKAEQLIEKIFSSNTVYEEDPEQFEKTYEELLKELSDCQENQNG